MMIINIDSGRIYNIGVEEYIILPLLLSFLLVFVVYFFIYFIYNFFKTHC